MFSDRRLLAITGLSGLLSLACLAPSDAMAQQIYRIVGPDGRVTFSDKPAADANARASTAAVPMPGAGGNNALPFELRQVASRYPVTLYAGPACGPCDLGRTFLSARGIPFKEKTVSSSEDIDALKRLVGAASLPVVTIGGQQLRGFSEIEWTQFLDAAGYPKSSQLPAGHTRSPATPLVVAEQPQAAPAAPEPPPSAALPPPPPAPAPAANPAGIRF
jgi:glutaredoxin